MLIHSKYFDLLDFQSRKILMKKLKLLSEHIQRI